MNAIPQANGLLMIGDPHVEGRIPGFRKDEYPRTVLSKIEWALRYARENSLVPIFLGDLFEVPRDNPNWLLVELLELFSTPVLGIYGNHDVRENRLNENDSLSILIESGRYRLLSSDSPAEFSISGRRVCVGGSSWGMPIPEQWPDAQTPEQAGQGGAICFWVTHHDIHLPGQYDTGYVEPVEIPGIAAIINGHVHRRLEPVTAGNTTWITAGNISRRKRDDASKHHEPAVLKISVGKNDWNYQWVPVPHRPFDEVFHEAIISHDPGEEESAFIAGLAQLESLKTETGQGLHEFLDQNLDQFDKPIADEIRKLAAEVTGNES